MTKGLHSNSLRKGEPNKWIVEDIIEKLKAEVERLKEENNNIRCDSNKAYCQGYGDAFVDLLSVLSDLESEKPTIQEQTACEDVSREEVIGLSIMAYLETHIKKDKGLVLRGVTLNDAREWIRRQIAKLPSPNDVICSQYHPNWYPNPLEEQPANKKLKEEIEYYLDHAELKAKCNGISVAQDYFDDLTNAARHFAKWGAEHLKK